MIALLALAFYFLILRPQRKRQQAVQKTMNALSPGNRVMLASGLFGTVVSVGPKQVVLETSPGSSSQCSNRRLPGSSQPRMRTMWTSTTNWTRRTRSQRTRRSRSYTSRSPERPIDEPPVAAAPEPAVEPDSSSSARGSKAVAPRLIFLNSRTLGNTREWQPRLAIPGRILIVLAVHRRRADQLDGRHPTPGPRSWDSTFRAAPRSR